MSTPAAEHAPWRPLSELRQRPHWSCSSISSLTICSLQWAFSHVYRQLPAFTPVNLAFGKTFHQALTWVAAERRTGSIPRADQVLELFSDLWRQACRVTTPPIRFDEGEGAEVLLALGRNMLAAYMENVNPEERVLAVSVPFSVWLRDAAGEALSLPVIGELDCVCDSPDGPLIVDWKTAARKWPEAKVKLDLQPTCYLYAVPQFDGRPVHGFRFEVITKTKVPAVERYDTVRGEDQFNRLAEIVKVIGKIVSAEAFLPSDQSWACADCPYAEPCKSWHRDRRRSLYRLELAA